MALEDKITQTDCIIIGAGPVGLFAVFQCGMLKMRCAVIDALPEIGGQCTALYPEKPIYDIPAYPVVSGEELIKNLEAQAAPFEPQYFLNQKVEILQEQEDGHWLVETTAGEMIKAPNVILAAGAGAFGPNRPPLENIESFEEHSVHYMVRNRDMFKGQKLVIAGGGDSAVDWALSLAEVAQQVYVVHRRDKFRAAPDNVEKMKALHNDPDKGFELVTPYQLSSLEGADGKLENVIVKTMAGEERKLEADHMLAFFGIVPDLSALDSWGLETKGYTIVVDPATCETTKKGIYAIGDVAGYDGKLKLILTGFAEGAQAAHGAYARCYPGEALHFEYSTSKGVPAAKAP
jgi:thioredoxin reductase (NADPH)